MALDPGLLPDYRNPELMAIGDSLYQGVRSLTVKQELNRFSAPAQVAHALGVRFAVPDHPRAVLIDFERWLTMLPDVVGIEDDLAASAQFWLRRPTSPSGRPVFDNVAVSGSLVRDLYAYSPASAAAEIADILPKLKGKPVGFADTAWLSRLIYALNARFTLNPLQQPGLETATQLDLAVLRRPKRLLINIGSNNGLWDMAFDADPTAALQFGKNYEDIRELADRLRALPDTEIYFNNLARPRTVANLMPVPDYEEWTEKPEAGYFAAYENRFGFSYGSLTADQLADLDEAVDQANADIAAILTALPNVGIVDMCALLASTDAKHYGDVQAVETDGDARRFSNVITESNPWGGMSRGGLFGLDGMHPTMLGYALMAQQVLAALKQPPHEHFLLDALRQDWLINHVPGSWTALLYLWRDVRKGLSASGDQAARATVVKVAAAGARGRGREASGTA